MSEAQDGVQCRIRIRPINAPFNIMGMPAYLGFYVTHNWEDGYMAFAPHDDSDRQPLSVASKPLRELTYKLKSNNAPDGNFWAFGIALLIAIGFAIVWTQFWKSSSLIDFSIEDND